MNYSFFYPQNIFLTPTYEEDRKIIFETFELLQKNFELSEVNEKQKTSLNILLEDFELIKNYQVVFLIDSIKVQQTNYEFDLLLLSINSGAQTFTRHEIREQTLVEYEFIALARLKNEYGHVIMRPELLRDKISELLGSVEVDFKEEPEFSKTYFVLSNNETLFRKNISHKILRTIGNYKGLYLEIVDNLLLIQMKKQLSKDALIKLVSITHEIIVNE